MDMPAPIPTTSPGYVPFPSAVIHSPAVDVSLPIPLANLKGRTIVITGGASGFGAACAAHWASHGANVIIGDRNASQGTELIARLRQSSGHSNHHFLPLDVTKWSSQTTFFREAARLSPHRGIDAVMANAGISNPAEQHVFEEPPDYSAQQDPPAPELMTHEVNLTGVLYTSHLALSYLSRNPGSRKCSLDANRDGSHLRDRHLLLVASIAGLEGLVGLPLYTAAKHGVVGLFRAMRLSAPMKTGVRVNMINPYFVDTPIMGPLGALVLAGGTMASLSSVVDACTRLMADTAIIGRGLAIGGKTSIAHAQEMGLELQTDDQDIWDCYGHDFEQSDLFSRRIVGVTNLITQAKGWGGLWLDLYRGVSKKAWDALGFR